MELLNDTLENFLKAQSEDGKDISQHLTSQGSLNRLLKMFPRTPTDRRLPCPLTG